MVYVVFSNIFYFHPYLRFYTVYGSWSVRFVWVRVLRFGSVRGDSVPAEDSHFDSYFSIGLKPPTSGK